MDASIERLRGTPLGNLDPITEVAEEAGVHSAAQSRAGSGHASRTASFNDLADAANGGRPPYARQNSGLKGLAGALKKASEGPTSAPTAAVSGSSTGTGAGAAPTDGAASEEESIAFEVVAPATADKPERRYSMVMKASKLSKLTMGRLKRNLSTSVGLPVESLLLCLMADPQSGLEDAWTAADLGITQGSVLHLLEREGLSGSAAPSTVQDLRSFLPPPPPPPQGTAHKSSKGGKKSNGLTSPGRGQGMAAELPSPSAPTALRAAPVTVLLGSSSGSTLESVGLTGGLGGGSGSAAQPSAFHATTTTASKNISDLLHSAPSPILSDGPATSLSVLVSERERNSSGRNSPTKAAGTPSSTGSAGFQTANTASLPAAAPAALSRRAPSSNALPSVPLAAAVDALNTPLSVPPALAKRMRLRRIFSSLLATEESAFSYGSPPSGGAFGGPSRSATSPGESRGFVSRAELAAAVSSDAEASSWPEYDPLIRSLLLGDQAVDGVTWSEASDLLQSIGEQVEKGGSSKSGSANRTSRAEVSSAFAPTSARKSENDSRASGEQLFLASPPRMVSSVALAVVSTGGSGPVQAEATSEESIMKPLHGVAQSVATPVPVPATAAKYAPLPRSQPLQGLASTLSPGSAGGKRMPSAMKAYRDVVLEVEISDGRVLELPIRIGEEPFALAAGFCSQYNLPIEDASNLADLIRPRLQQAYELELADARQAVADALTALDTANARIESAASTSSLKSAHPASSAAGGAVYSQAELDEAVARAVAQARTDARDTGGVTADGSLSTALADAAEAKRQLASLQGEMETLKGERSVLQVEKNSLAGAVQELEEKLAELVNKLGSAELRASDSESRARALEDERSMEKGIWRESMEGASQEVARAHEMTTQVEKELADAQAQLKAAGEESSGLRAQIGALLTDIARLNGSLQWLQEELLATEQREQAAVARGDAITQEHAAALSDLARMEKALESAAIRIAESESALSSAVTERDRALAKAEATEATMDRMRSDFAEAQKRKSAWEKYVDNSSYDSSLSSSVAVGGADQTTRAVMGNSTVGGASQAGNVSMADLGSSLSSVAGLSSSLRPSSAIAASMQHGDWRTWAAEKREILARANADRAALIEENKRLRQALGYGEADVEAKLRAQDEAVAALQGELLVLRSALDRTEHELKTVYRQWEEDGRRWTQDRQRLLEELQAASVQLYGVGMQEGEYAFEREGADPALAMQ